jgi:hypothetical protein
MGDCLLGLKSKTGGSVHRTAQSLAERNEVTSERYFAKSQRLLIDTAHTGQVAAKEFTVIYSLSQTFVYQSRCPAAAHR